MLNIGPQELLLILVVALVVVGPRRLPEIGRSLGKGLREIRKAQDEVRKTIQVNLDDDMPPARTGARPPSAQADPGEAGPSAALPTAAAAASEPIGEVSKTLGRGLAELRKARREIERTFRVDLDRPPAGPRPAATAEPAASAAPAPAPEAEGPPETDRRPAPE